MDFGFVALLPRLALWVLLLIVGVEAYRRYELVSLPWLALYIVASFGVEVVWKALDVHDILWAAFLHDATRLVLAILVLSDVLFVLSKANIAVEGRLWNKLIRVRERSTTWGIVMLILLLSSAALVLVP